MSKVLGIFGVVFFAVLGSFKYLSQGVTQLAGYFGLYNEAATALGGFFDPKIVLEVSPTGSVHRGDNVYVNFDVPDYGYMSLWNQNAHGEVKRLWPDAKGASAYPLTPNSHSDRVILRPDTAGMVEKIVMLWTPSKSAHLPQVAYSSVVAFESDKKTLENSGKERTTEIQVLAE